MIQTTTTSETVIVRFEDLVPILEKPEAIDGKYHTVYRTTNRINQHFYVGVHITGDPFDSYRGSGKVLNSAMAKYGTENFDKEILVYASSEEEAYRIEAAIVTEEFTKRADVYNIKIGGFGGFPELTPEQRSARNKKARDSMGPERRSLATKKGNETKGPEIRSLAAKKANETLGPEGRHLASKKGHERKDSEGRSISFQKRLKTMGPERRSLASKKGNETKRRMKLEAANVQYQEGNPKAEWGMGQTPTQVGETSFLETSTS